MFIKHENLGITYPSSEQWYFAVDTIERLQRAGFQALMVGGCVRDILLGVNPEDYDIAVSARPEETLAIFPNADKIGVKYGVLKIKDSGKCVQVASFRRDHLSSDGRRPKTVYFSTIDDDAERRDFTINAMYLDPISGDFYDPFNGRKDLVDKIIRFVGEPKVRIKEDYLRILRAVRFASRFNLGIEENSLIALKDNSHLVERISIHRVMDEIGRSFYHENRVYAFDILHLLKILPIFWDIFKDIPAAVNNCRNNLKSCESCQPEEVWGVFYLSLANSGAVTDWINENLQRLCFNSKLKKSIIASIEGKYYARLS